MPKFFTDIENFKDDKAYIYGEDVNHISKVLRMNVGDKIILCDGIGYDYDSKIISVSKNEIICDVISKIKNNAEPNLKITVFQALPKQSKMESIIQKSTELGVFEIIPVYTKRCVAKPSDKSKRWQKVALEASKQCQRGVVPKVLETVSFKEAINLMKNFENKILFYENEENITLKQLLNKKIKNIAIMVGPEGGFDIEEIAYAKENNIDVATLGKRILRTETVASAVIPVIMFTQNEF